MKEIEHIYSKLFRLPSLGMALVLMFTSCLALSALMDLSLNSFLTIQFTLFTLITLTSSLLASLLTTFLTRKSQYQIFDFRRSTSLSTISNFLTALLLAFFLAFRLLSITDWVETLILSLSVTFIFRLAIIYGLSEINGFLAVSSSIFQPAILICLIIPFIHFNYIYLGEFLIFLSVFGMVFQAFLEFTDLKINGVKLIELFRGFAIDWILGDPSKLEEELTKISEERTLPVATILFRSIKNRRLKALLVVPSIHPGPFKNVGSSNLPYVISSRVEEATGIKTIVFHGASTHELDLASRGEVERVADEMLKHLNVDSFYNRLTPPLKVNVGSFEVSAIKFGSLITSFVSRLNADVEDISYDVNMFLNSNYRSEENIVIVDLHNSIADGGKPIRIGDRESMILIEAILNVVGKLSESKKYELELGVSKQRPSDISPLEGLGPDGLSLIVSKIGEVVMVIVLFDSNNLIKGLRENLAKEIRKHLEARFKNVLINIASTDTHSTVAIATGAGYNPLGKMTSHEKIVDLVLRGLDEAVSNLEKVEFNSQLLNISNLRVIGRMNDLLKFLIKRSYETMKIFLGYIIPIAVGLSLLVTSII